MDKRTLALLAAFCATTIYALNHTIAKEVMPTYIQGLGFVQLRLLGATVLFWLVSVLIRPQRGLNALLLRENSLDIFMNSKTLFIS